MKVQFLKSLTSNEIKIIHSNTEVDIDGFVKLVANTVDKGGEKHLPIFKIDDSKIEVTVGEILHPMEESHFINFIYIETTNGGHIKFLKPNEKPQTTFFLTDNEKPIAIYEYCNMHGLWKTNL